MPPKNKVKTMRSSSGSASSKALTKAKATPVARSRLNVRGRRGGLQDMPKMPLDVLFEIFAFLHPRDLLNLARTAKDFRALLMSRNAARFWEKARKQVKGLPDKPQHLSEPAYANLVFFTHCHNCLKTGASVTAYWKISARYCASCRNKAFISSCDDIWKLIMPFTDVEAHDVVTCVYLRSKRLRGAWYHKAELEEVKRDWKSLKNKTQKMQYIRERQKYIEQCGELSHKLDWWQDGLKELAAAEIDSRRQNRCEAVLARLREEGWGEELDRMDEVSLNGLYGLDGVSRTTKLTNNGWATIRGCVVEYMQKVKSHRFYQERANLIYRRLWKLKDVVDAIQHAKWPSGCKDRVYASFSDCASYMPEVRAIIEDTPADVETDTIMAELQEILPSLLDRWLEDRRSELVALLRTKLGEDSPAARVPDPLQLAIALFSCDECDEDRLRWPVVADHRCCWMNPEDDLYEKILNMFHQRSSAYRRFPGIESIDMDPHMEYTREIISLCGADPDTVTYAEMEACVVRLACRRCATYAKQQILDWNDAILHDLHHRRWDYLEPLSGRWMLVSEENAAKARELEAAIYARPFNLNDTDTCDPDQYHCSWCGHADRLSEIYRHLQESHGKSQEESKLDEDFYLLKRSRPDIWMFSDVFSESKIEKELVATGHGFFASF